MNSYNHFLFDASEIVLDCDGNLYNSHPVFCFREESVMKDEQVVVKVKRLISGSFLPARAKEGDAAFDLYSITDHMMMPGETYGVPTGIALEIPAGYEGQVRPRSGLALKHGITILNSPGTIDSGYRGEVKIIVHNMSDEPFNITKGMRIAQIAIRPVPDVQFIEVDTLEGSDRGDGGFGSTGI